MCVCTQVYVCVHVCMCVYDVYVYTLFTGIIVFNARLALVSFSTAVEHATTISIKNPSSIANMLSGFSFFPTVVCP